MTLNPAASLIPAWLASFAAGLVVSSIVAAQPLPPLPKPGPHPVGCSNVEQDFDRVPPGETAQMYWRGFASADAERYVTALLTDPEHALVATFTAPADQALYARWAGKTVTYALLVCYPTTQANDRAEYALPNGNHVPRMQRGAEGPLLPAPGRHPVLLFSHGYAGSPLTHTYLDALVAFASHGWISVAPFHGGKGRCVKQDHDRDDAAAAEAAQRPHPLAVERRRDHDRAHSALEPADVLDQHVAQRPVAIRRTRGQ
jgi:hypothetical protein